MQERGAEKDGSPVVFWEVPGDAAHIDTEGLYYLDDRQTEQLILKMKKHQTSEVFPSTSSKGKRKLDLQGESSEGQSSRKRRHNEAQPDREALILFDVKKIMRSVLKKLPDQGNTKLNEFLRTKIHDLKTDKREVIGVFGRTGAGKSSLINAIIGEEDLLPTADDGACTSVMIKVESNRNSLKYKAKIKFIRPEYFLF